jgi:2-polyprenyl-3-methyl-5-hydroxy-6-metoxy-1,4-benzoquinol methylase
MDHELRASWDANAAPWTDAVRGGAIASRRAGTDAAVLDAVGAHGPGRVLDVGCGEGWLARALTARGFDVEGIDGSAALIEAATRSGGATFRRLGYDEAAADPSTLGGPFDTVVCNFALLGDPLAPLLAALRTATAPGGRLIVQTVHPIAAGEPYADGWRTERFEAFGTGEWRAMPWYFRTFAGWLAEIHRAGWRIQACREPLDPATARPISLLLVCR